MLQRTEKRDAAPNSVTVKLPILPQVKKGSCVFHKSFGNETVVKVDMLRCSGEDFLAAFFWIPILQKSVTIREAK